MKNHSEKYETRPIRIDQTVTLNDAGNGSKEIGTVKFRTNIKPGHVLRRVIFAGSELWRVESYRVTKVKDYCIEVIWMSDKSKGREMSGIIGFQDLLGSLSPAPDKCLISCYQLIIKKLK